MMFFPIAEASEAQQELEKLSKLQWDDYLPVIIVLLIGIPLVLFLARTAGRLVKKHHSPQAAFITHKAVLYTGVFLLVATVLSQLNINLSVILAGAGIGALAVGFAAQTSLSNLISGVFLLMEKPFAIGDTINANGVVGTVLSIDLLSVKLNTPDNLFVRIPNASLIQNNCTTITRNAIRRLDINIGIGYGENIARVIEVVNDVILHNPLALEDPAALVTATAFGDSAINILIGAWCKSGDFTNLRNSLMHDIKERFEREHIEIPFPYLTLTTPDGKPAIKGGG